MIETEAEVLRTDNQHAWVRVRPHTPCGNCDPETGCKSVAMTRMFSGKEKEFLVNNPLSAVVGDKVVVAIHEGVLLQGALWGYGLPLSLLMLGACVGYFAFPHAVSDLATLIGAVSGALVAFMILRQRRGRLAEPEIILKRPAGSPEKSSCKRKMEAERG